LRAVDLETTVIKALHDTIGADDESVQASGSPEAVVAGKLCFERSIAS
jgi:hypothetical protein